MKRKVHLTLALVLAALALPVAGAAVLEAPLPAYAAPDSSAPILGTARSGTALSSVPAPAGWAAVELVGPHTVYITHKDTLKNFEVRPGAAYLSAPRADAPVLGLAGENDAAEFADVEGKFNKFSLNKALVAYVRVPVSPVAPVAVPAHSAAPAAETLPPLMDDLPGTLPQNIPANRPVAAGQSVESGEPRLARTFFGVVASSRNPLRPRRPYDFQLNDDGGSRIAYLDISKLLLTEQIEAFVGRPVSILGTVENVGSNLVIRVESLKLQ